MRYSGGFKTEPRLQKPPAIVADDTLCCAFCVTTEHLPTLTITPA